MQFKFMTGSINLEALIDSIEIFNNPITMDALRRSDIDIKYGRVKEITSIEEMICELYGKNDTDKTIR